MPVKFYILHRYINYFLNQLGYLHDNKADIAWTFVEYQNLFTETSNIQRREAELNIVSTSVNKFDVQQKSIQYLLCYKLLFKKNERNEKISVQKFFH